MIPKTIASGRGAKRLVIENDQMAWEFARTGQSFASVGLKNKLSGRYYPLKEVVELRLTFAGAKARIDISWWRCTFGPDNDPTPPQEETGVWRGYHQNGFDDTY